ncbi:MAG: ribonuclease D, partial [Xanthomonadales bacterium]|nr:ribonuclease D [Xanthomonadales bacterium]
TARRVDVPRPWLIDDARVLEFAMQPPGDVASLQERTRGLRALRSAERAALFDALREPLHEDELSFAPIPPAAGPQERRAITTLKEIVVARATALDIPEGLLCSRRHLETLWLTRAWPSALEGWRRALLHDELMARLADL